MNFGLGLKSLSTASLVVACSRGFDTVPICQELTMEEYSFLEEYGLADDDGTMESQTWSTGDDNGMGEEMEAAFEEFLRTQS